jgi:hypothetical protein
MCHPEEVVIPVTTRGSARVDNRPRSPRIDASHEPQLTNATKGEIWS